jgi:hypothetical protein
MRRRRVHRAATVAFVASSSLWFRVLPCSCVMSGEGDCASCCSWDYCNCF